MQHIKSGMVIQSNVLAEMIWPNMTGRDPRWPTAHPYAPHVSMALKEVKGAKRDRYTKDWIID